MTGSFGDGIPIPDVIDPPDSMPMTLCIPRNRDHMAAFFGALYQLTVWNSWQQDGTQHGKELAAVWWRYYLSWNRNMNDLECEDDMGNCCTEPAIIQRVNPTTGRIEQSTDNGGTWTPSPNALQALIVQPVPPVTSGVAGSKCDAALNVNVQMGYWITHVSNNFDTAVTLLDFGIALIGVIADAVLLVLTGGQLGEIQAKILAALSAAMTAVWLAGKTLFDDYWTTAVRKEIKCALVAHIGEDGAFTDEQFSAAWNEINDNLPGSPAKMLFMGFLSSVGKSGLNAMAASGTTSEGDCSECSGACSTASWIASSGTIVTGTRTSTFVQIDAVLLGDGKYYIVFSSEEDNTCCDLSVNSDNSGQTYYVGAGRANLSFYQPCGLDWTGLSSGVGRVAWSFGSHSMNGMFWRGDEPFTLAIDTTRTG